jgi:hypothetical protein
MGPVGVTPILAGAFAGKVGQVEAGLRVGDLSGRHEHMVIGALGTDGAARGGLVSTAWTILPVKVRAEGFGVRYSYGREVRAGGLLGLSATRHGRPLRLDLDLGVLADVPLRGDIEGERTLGYADIGALLEEPHRGAYRLWWTARGQLGDTGGQSWARGEGTVGGRVGRGAFLSGRYTRGWSNAESELDQYRLGGVPTSVVPGPWLWSRVTDGAFAVGAWSGALREEVQMSLGTGLGQVYGVRHRMGDALSGAGASAVGVRTVTSLGSQPFLGTPALSVSAGVACRVESPLDGWAKRPCTQAQDYSAWASLVVRR